MNRPHRLLVSSALLFALAFTACGKEKADALAQIDKIKAACAANERKQALDIMLAAAEKNETFGKSFRNVTADVPDKTTVEACGDIPDRVKKHLEEQ